MTNPYSPPQSQLQSTEELAAPSVFWKIFFWINVIFIPLGLLGVMMTMKIGILDFIDIAIGLVAVVGLYKYAFRKKLVRVQVWKSITVVYLAWFVVYEAILPLGFGTLIYGEPLSFDFSLLISILMTGLTAFGLFLFSFRGKG